MYRTGRTKHGERHVAYIRNQKAASQLLTYELGQLLDLAGPPRSGISITRSPLPENASTFVFSFVRDPFEAALKGYLELRHLAAFRSIQYRAALARAFADDSLPASATGPANASSIVPCTSERGATAQFRGFLASLQRGDPLGGDVYHAQPQALKLDHVAYGAHGRDHGYDAIGRVETLAADLQAIRAVLALPPSAHALVGSLDLSSPLARSRRHSHRHEPCAQIDRTDPQLMALFCNLYHADYVCFGEALPAACGGSVHPWRSS